jgi:Ca2+:H+ antiporter
MPQERIDEESHPGVLADLLDSSTSSDSSSSSSSTDSDNSSGSHTTAKKIKRFIRKRRKSSASSNDAPSFPSHVSSPTSEPNAYEEALKSSHSGSAILPDILSGDEGDTDGVRNKNRDFGAPKHRDMQDAYNGEASRSPEPMSPVVKPRKKSKKHRKHKHKKNELPEPAIELSEKPAINSSATPTNEAALPRVGFADDVNFKEGAPVATKKSPLKPFPRPALPKLLSQNVFVDPQPSGSPSLAPVRTTSRSGAPALRRTNSLPDRLSEPRTSQGARPLPPFVARSVLAARTRTDTDASEQVEDEDEDEHMSRTAAVMMLLISTGLVALCAEFLVDAIPAMTNESAVSQAFIGLIILPIVGNAAEHVTAVTVAAKNKMDLAIGVAVGSSIQIALFVTPLVVILGWCMNKGMSLYFNLFETVSLFATAFVVNFLVLDGRSNYLEGTLLIAAYVIIA